MITEIALIPINRTDPILVQCMGLHYSKPRGFVGRNICYLIMSNGKCFGTICGGSATRFLPNRNQYFGIDISGLDNVINNIFFHIERKHGKYPCRWFVPKVLRLYREQIERDWQMKYGDNVIGHESLVELPRNGDCYKQDGWELIGQTKGYTCKRVAGKGTDSWTGKRVWDTNNLRPKLVFVHKSNNSTPIAKTTVEK